MATLIAVASGVGHAQEEYFLSSLSGPWHETALCGGGGTHLATWSEPGQRDAFNATLYAEGVHGEVALSLPSTSTVERFQKVPVSFQS